MFNDMIRAVYSKVAEPGNLMNIMSTVAVALKAESSFIFTSHSPSSPDALLLGHNIDPEDVKAFATVWCHEDVWAREAGRRSMMRRNVVVTGDELVDCKSLHRSTFYNEFGKAAGLDAMVGTVLFDGSETQGKIPFTNLCWYRGKGKARFQAGDKLLLRTLMPHLQQALLMHYQLYQLKLQHLVAGAGACGPQLASLIIDESARIVMRNSGTESVVNGRPALVGTIAERITGLGRRSLPTLPDAISNCRATGSAVSLLIQEFASGQLLTATLSALPADTATFVGAFSKPLYLLVIEVPGSPDLDLVVKAAKLFDCTPSETAVALALVRGLTVEEVAKERGSSIHTIRSQVRGLLHKTGQERVVHLVRMLCQLVR